MKVKLAILFVFSTQLFIKTQACLTLSNQIKGEITTPGYPDRLDFNDTCFFIRLEDGRIKTTIQNVSLPDGAKISINLYDYIVGVHDLVSRVSYSKSKLLLIEILLPLANASVTNSYNGVRILYEKISEDVCRYTYQADGESPEPLRSPNFPKKYRPNMNCEYMIESRHRDKRVLIVVHDLKLSPSDDITFYDGSDDSVLARYNGTTRLRKSVTSKSMSVRVVFRSSKDSSKKSRHFLLKYSDIEKGVCLEKYVAVAGRLWSGNKSCTYVIETPGAKLELKFKDLFIPANDRIMITMVPLLDPKEVFYIMPGDSGQVRYIVGKNILGDSFEIMFNSSTKFYLKFKPYRHDFTVNLDGVNGTLKSPYYPQSYTEHVVTYHVEVPNGHVKLNFTELKLQASNVSWREDYLRIYDGPSYPGHILGDYTNKNLKSLPVVISSGNTLTVRFVAHTTPYQMGTMFRFMAVFTRETNVNYCKPLNVPNAYAAQNLTIPGWTTSYYCKEGYYNVRKGYYHRPNVDRVCSINGGEWEPGRVPNCLRLCQHLEPILKVNSTLSWYPDSRDRKIYDGQIVTFTCGYYKDDLIGPENIKCTSHGNYSASPPKCVRGPDKPGTVIDLNTKSGFKTWIILAVAGAIFFIVMTIVALRFFCGWFRCLSNSHQNTYVDELDKLNDSHKRNRAEETGL